MKGFLPIPDTGPYCLENVSPGSAAALGTAASCTDRIYVADGLISKPHGGPVIDAGGAMALPTFVDMHTHLDKAHMWPRAANAVGTLEGALEALGDRAEECWQPDDIRRRMDFSLRCAYAHGTRAIRTHLDSWAPQHRITWPVFDEVRQDWSGRIDLQAVTILSMETIGDDGGVFEDIADTAAGYGGALGCVTFPVPEMDRRLDHFFRVAAERGMQADLHADETGNADSATLRAIAESALRTGFEGRIVAGHCCSLAMQDDDEVDRTLDLVARAGISVVSLPMCNLYLQDRSPGRTPRWRGVTLVHEMRDRGIPVAFASDNTRDPFYAYGDMDMVEVMREATRICHLDHSDPPWHDAYAQTPAEICGFAANRLSPGEPADFVIFNARSWSELLPRPQWDRVVVRNGRAIDRTLPRYSELDDLMETR